MHVSATKPLSEGEAHSRLWESFWREAGADGCTAAFPTRARSALQRRWQQYFLKIKRGSVLDIATGRGAVLRHAATALPGASDFTLTGVDLAHTLPPDTEWMSFVGGMSAASLTFEDRSFDHVTSQFGIEYSDFNVALGEAARVCARTMLLLVHAAEGVVIRQNKLQAEQADWLLEELHFFEALATHLAQPTEASVARLARLFEQVTARARADENTSLLEGVLAAAVELQERARRQGRAGSQSAVAGLVDQLSGHRRRMVLLGRAGVSREQAHGAASTLQKLGFPSAAVSEERFGCEGQLVGYWLQATRTDDQERKG